MEIKFSIVNLIKNGQRKEVEEQGTYLEIFICMKHNYRKVSPDQEALWPRSQLQVESQWNGCSTSGNAVFCGQTTLVSCDWIGL